MSKNLALSVCCVLLLVAIRAQAQTATGVIQGTISDSSGAMIVGARVTLTDQGTNQTREQATNSA
jgi:hypothetical protein